MTNNRVYKALLAAMLVGMMAFAFAGCSGSTTESGEPETTEATTEETTETATAESTDFNLLQTVQDAGIKSCLPEDIDYVIEDESENSVGIYLKSAMDADLGGRAGSVMAFEQGDESYKDFPEYAEIGSKDGVQYIIMFASDVQYNPEDSKQADDYNRLVEGLKTFEIK